MSFPKSTAQPPQPENMKTFTTATADSLVHTPTTHIANRVRQWHITFCRGTGSQADVQGWSPGALATSPIYSLMQKPTAVWPVICNVQVLCCSACYLCTVQRRTGGACLPGTVAPLKCLGLMLPRLPDSQMPPCQHSLQQPWPEPTARPILPGTYACHCLSLRAAGTLS